MKRLTHVSCVAAVLSCLVLPSLGFAAPPDCDTRCSCAVSCSTLCSNGGVITCGKYGDCIDLCGRVAANQAPVQAPFFAAPEACSAPAAQDAAPTLDFLILQ
jgi:hypothetical protein